MDELTFAQAKYLAFYSGKISDAVRV